MKIITIYSDSHKELLDKHFLPSLPSSLVPTVIKQNQHGSGEYGTHPEFVAAVREKLVNILHHLRSEKNPFLYSDVDVRFNPLLDPVPTLLNFLQKNIDMVCQRDGNDICTGFMLFNPSEKNSSYLQAVIEYMDSNRDKHDQICFKELYHSNLYAQERKPNIKLIDINDGFGNYNHIRMNVLWNLNDNDLEKHKDIIRKQFMWHANHTIGVQNKMEMLKKIQQYLQ